jgi:hypothetical protein
LLLPVVVVVVVATNVVDDVDVTMKEQALVEQMMKTSLA